MTNHQRIRKSIEEAIVNIGEGGRYSPNFVIYPFGEMGIQVKQILNECFGIKECCIIDNGLCKINKDIKSIEYLSEIDVTDLTILFTAVNPEIVDVLKHNILDYCDEKQIVDIFSIEEVIPEKVDTVLEEVQFTECGKYSYGPLCNHRFVEKVGAFSCIADGAVVVENHAMDYISMHPFIYHDTECTPIYKEKYEECSHLEWYFAGVKPKGKAWKNKKICIGNDVWIGRNVIITNGANIGNGVLVAAGTVVTKDVPDYAVVAGVPARIIRYRYNKEQIASLNRIAWWDWSDEKIRENYEDFFLPVDEFIKKHTL